MNSNLNKYMGLAAAAIVLLLLVIWYFNTHKDQGIPSFEEQATTTVATIPMHLNEEAPYYQIATSYPSDIVFPAPVPASGGSVAEQAMATWVKESIAEFKKNGNFANLSHDDVQLLGLDQRKYQLGIEYVEKPGIQTITYLYTVFTDTGGAHPNTTYRAFTYDLTTGAELSIADLFTPGADYLGTLSAIARADLPRILGTMSVDDFITDGTEPRDENFANFYFEDGKLSILFPPYQVAPYAAGSVTLPIDTSRIANILKIEYR